MGIGLMVINGMEMIDSYVLFVMTVFLMKEYFGSIPMNFGFQNMIWLELHLIIQIMKIGILLDLLTNGKHLKWLFMVEEITEFQILMVLEHLQLYKDRVLNQNLYSSQLKIIGY